MNYEQVEEFLIELEGPEGCNFQMEPDKPETATWHCGGGHDQSHSRKILNKMGIPKGERDAFLKECTELGGHCDCEIVFNAADTLLGRREE